MTAVMQVAQQCLCSCACPVHDCCDAGGVKAPEPLLPRFWLCRSRGMNYAAMTAVMQRSRGLNYADMTAVMQRLCNSAHVFVTLPSPVQVTRPELRSHDCCDAEVVQQFSCLCDLAFTCAGHPGQAYYWAAVQGVPLQAGTPAT
eukprot:1161053-Pelagomonas_calceolata.AAC.6